MTIDEILEAAKKATPGPWTVEDRRPGHGGYTGYEIGAQRETRSGNGGYVRLAICTDTANAHDNATLIAGAPQLAAEVERLRLERTEILKLLRWALTEIEASAEGIWADDECPPHVCEFIENPEIGYCEFHEKYWDIQELLKEAGR